MATPPKAPARLGTRWVFWRDRWDVVDGETTQSLVDLGEAETARNFWSLFSANSIDDLPDNCSLQVFKHHVKPEWEDKHNINGGHFRFAALNQRATTPPPSDKSSPESRLWYSLVTTAIGDQLTLASSVCGVGITNKGTRKVISVWVSTSDPSAIRSLQHELGVYTADKFSSKFVAHRSLPRSTFTATQTCNHRRTKSAPDHFLNLEFDDDEEKDATQPTSPGMKRRAAPGPLDRTAIPVRSVTDEDAHQRSKSEGLARDVVPNLASMRRSPPPQEPQESWTWSEEASSQRSSGIYPSVKAPTPMKAWADQWSPSLLNTALSRPANFGANRQATDDGVQAMQAQHLQGATGAATSDPSPMNLSATQQASATPQLHAYGQPAHTQPAQTTASQEQAAADRRSQHTKSESPPFVFKGWQYPGGLNRKERRRIMFSDEVTPAEYPGAVFVGEEVPDGPVEEK